MKLFTFTTLLILFYSLSAYTQNPDEFKVLFYNVENLFDPYDDSLKNDEEFLPDGDRYWTKNKYYDKLNKIYKVITAVGQWNMPAIIGLSEIENKKVLNHLVQNTPLVKFEYQIIHKESPDKRGIDVGMLFRPELFRPINTDFMEVIFPDNPNSKTRDILYVKGVANELDTLHVFINHWPSRWGGQLETEDKRMFVASLLKSKIDSILHANINSNIIITGDFNDYPNNKSLKKVLAASTEELNSVKKDQLYNLSAHIMKTKKFGSHKYQGEWGVLDQFIVSGNLLDIDSKVNTSVNNTYIFQADFLLEQDEAYFGYKPYRTFIGYRYNGGFSDHLPTYLVLNFNE